MQACVIWAVVEPLVAPFSFSHSDCLQVVDRSISVVRKSVNVLLCHMALTHLFSAKVFLPNKNLFFTM
jgi:hypothetical protein